MNFIKNSVKSKESVADKFGDLAKLRNIIAHEYLDITWKKIQNFFSEADKLYPQFIEKLEVLVKKI